MSTEPILSREAVRALDARAIQEYGIPSIVLMENAGRAAAEEALALREDHPGPVLVLAGPGNNGGDGFVVARTLVNRGVPARVVFVGSAEKLDAASADVGTNARLWRGLGMEIEGFDPPLTSDGRSDGELARALDSLRSDLAAASLVVDALFGTGLTRALREPWLGVVRAINDSGRPVLSLDIPSGLDADTGEVLGDAVCAQVTVTFVARKPGFERGEGPRRTGRVVVAEIGIPRTYLDAAAAK